MLHHRGVAAADGQRNRGSKKNSQVALGSNHLSFPI
jgi:hypothetical protein